MQFLLEELFIKISKFINKINVITIRFGARLVLYSIIIGILYWIIFSIYNKNYFSVIILVGLGILAEIAHYIRMSREKVMTKKINKKNLIKKKSRNKNLLKINKTKNKNMLKVSQTRNKNLLDVPKTKRLLKISKNKNLLKPKKSKNLKQN